MYLYSYGQLWLLKGVTARAQTKMFKVKKMVNCISVISYRWFKWIAMQIGNRHSTTVNICSTVWLVGGEQQEYSSMLNVNMLCVYLT